MRISRVRRTDYRPPGAGTPRPPERQAARPGAAASPDPEAREAAEHDRNVAGLPPATVIAAARDLCARRVFNHRDPESRWILSRRAALLRRIRDEHLQP